MNSKSMHIDRNLHTNFDSAALQPSSIIGKIYNALHGMLVRTELEKAQAGYRAKQQRHSSQHDILRDLAVEDKLRHGMYRWMD